MKLAAVLIDVRNAYEAHDHVEFERTLTRVQAMLEVACQAQLDTLDQHALEHRRAEVAADLNAIDAEIQRRQTG